MEDQMPRPTYKPNWDTTVANSVRPVYGAQTQGVADGFTLPAKWLNWMFNNIYLWIVQFAAELDAINSPTSDDVSNESTVSGSTVTVALDTLSAAPLLLLQGDFSVTFPGAQTVTFYWRKYSGDFIEMYWDTAIAMTSAENHDAGICVPVSARPTVSKSTPVCVNGENASATMAIVSTGQLIVYGGTGVQSSVLAAGLIRYHL
jgi:hypothetical protein